MDYFETLISEIDKSINIETEKMLEASKLLREATDKIEELKRQKNTVLSLNTKIEQPY
jgi:hypothetical protein